MYLRPSWYSQKQKRFELEELLQYEKEALGLYVSGHPLQKYEDVLSEIITHDSLSLCSTEEGEEVQDDEDVIMGGIIVGAKTTITKTNKPMAFLQIEDLYGTFEVVVFPRLYESKIALTKKDEIVWIKGKASRKDEGLVTVKASNIYDLTDSKSYAGLQNKKQTRKPKEKNKVKKSPEIVRTEDVSIPNENPESFSEDASIVIALDQRTSSLLSELKNVMLNNAGATKIILYDKQKNKKYLADQHLWVKNEVCVLNDLRDIVGVENVKLL
jgi:DNA polymerase-3 subunit alpha